MTTALPRCTLDDRPPADDLSGAPKDDSTTGLAGAEQQIPDRTASEPAAFPNADRATYTVTPARRLGPLIF
jgi:hypothetical protein